ncbi:competence protein ComEC [Synechococcus sp. TAK9802]|nr:competence protein ComEC [Synechococcus sp. TAK9802]
MLWGAPTPSRSDSSRLIQTPPAAVAISGRLLADVRRFPSGCSGLLELDRIDARRVDGRTELQFPECPAPLLQGWRVQATGVLRRPLPAVHPLLPGSAERLARQGSWSQLRAESIEVLQRPWTPLADLRRDVAQRLQQAVGPRRGGFLAALVLGSAQVQLPEDNRAAFRLAGLSHALAASGFHLSVLLGSVLMLARRWPPGLRLPLAATALLLFLCLAGAEPSVVRAVLMAAMALLIREAGHHSRPVGVLLLTLSGMLLLRPAWALSIGFQLSAAATAGLILTAPRLEKAVQAWLPDRCQGLAAALSIPVAALLWTLPLQLLHFGAMPLYALVANLLVAPLLAMLSALLVLVGPTAVLPLMLWPVHQLAGLVITMASWISHWPGAQLLTGRPQMWVVALLVLGLLLWLLGAGPCRRCWSLISLATALLVQGLVQLSDGLVTVERFDRHWLLSRHRGRAALVSTHGDARSCRMAKKLAAVHGHGRLDWVLLLDPVATDVLACWQALAHRVEAPQQGQAPIAIGQVLRSDGLSVQRLQSRSGALVMRVGHQRWQLVPSPQALWALQQRQRSEPRPLITETWLGFKPSAPQRRWLLKHGAGARFVGL